MKKIGNIKYKLKYIIILVILIHEYIKYYDKFKKVNCLIILLNTS